MLTSNIKFKNFNISKFQNLKNFKNEKWFKKIRFLESLKPNYKYSYTRDQVKKIDKNKNFRLIGMGGSTLGVEAIYQFLNLILEVNIFNLLSFLILIFLSYFRLHYCFQHLNLGFHQFSKLF